MTALLIPPETDTNPVSYFLPQPQKAFNFEGLAQRVFLAAPFENEGSAEYIQNFSFYSEIKRSIEQLGKIFFSPHIHIKGTESRPTVFRQIDREINSSNLVLVHLVGSFNVDYMIRKATEGGIQQIFFHRDNYQPNNHLISTAKLKKLLYRQFSYASESDALIEVEYSVSSFFANFGRLTTS